VQCVAASVRLPRASRGHRSVSGEREAPPGEPGASQRVCGAAFNGNRYCPTCQGGRRVQWLDRQRETLLPVKVLSRVFRGKLLAFLRKQYQTGNLPMTGRLSALADPRRFARWLSALYEKDWRVYVEPPEDRPPEQALKYLARYTYRVAISNGRIEAIEGDGHHGRVTFWHKDHRHDKVWRRTSLPGVEFLRRFCAHVLPRGFVRIRPFGFLANCHRAEKLALIRRLLAADQAESEPPPAVEPMEAPGHRCPHCGEAALRLVAETARPSVKHLVAATYRLPPLDST